MDEAERIVITGMGVVAPIGIGVETFHRALADGKSGISVIEFPWHTGYKVLKAGQVKDFDWRLFLPASPKIGRASQLAVAASKLGLSWGRSEEHTSELQSRLHLVCRLLLEKKNKPQFCSIIY